MTEQQQPHPTTMIDNESKDVFFQQMKMTNVQMQRLWEFYKENMPYHNSKESAPSSTLLIEYQFSTIGPVKIARIGDKSIWIDEGEFNP